MKHLIAYMFLAIFSLQMLPVKEIGEILVKGQLTEEETHACGNKSDNNNSKLAKYNECLGPGVIENQYCLAFYNNILSTAFSVADKLPAGFIPDIATPPPNC